MTLLKIKMTSLRNLDFKTVYRSGQDDLYRDFYCPALQVSVQYDRAVGYFSSEILAMSMKGLSSLIKAGGRMRLIIGHPLSADEFRAVKQGIKLQDLIEDLASKLEEILTSPPKEYERLELLGWLIACNKLEVKFAARKAGMYHEKIGIFKDKHGDRVVFQGSANETPSGMISHFNAESISVFQSWDEEVFKRYGAEYEKAFERLWNNEEENTLTIDVPSETYERISAVSASGYDRINEHLDLDSEFIVKERGTDLILPKIPEYLGSQEFKIRKHQIDALTRWKSNSYKGILKLATGSGKTITSLYGAVKIFEARQRSNASLFLIIAVPYVELAQQWVSNLKSFNIYPHECFGSKSSWYERFSDQIDYFNAGVTPFAATVVVNRTLESSHFQSLIKELDESCVMFIGDECHNQGAAKVNGALPDAAYRLGLSATPFRSDDDEMESPFPNDAKNRILDYYGSIVSEYGLDDAIHDGVLTPYHYHIIPVYLTEQEQDIFDELSSKIMNLASKLSASGLTREEKDLFTKYCGQRSRLLGAAQNKIERLRELTADIPSDEKKHTLFYAGEGKVYNETVNDDLADDMKVIDEVSTVLKNNGWNASQFTSKIKRSDRQAIMSSFKDGEIEALVAMKVLDEGIDVPACKTAYILASSRNPRQYIQRRGRILRKANGKHSAYIYDFVILPIRDSAASKNLKRAESERINDFALLASNKLEIERIIENLGLTYA